MRMDRIDTKALCTVAGMVLVVAAFAGCKRIDNTSTPTGSTSSSSDMSASGAASAAASGAMSGSAPR
jgi:hypothetical protein